MNINNRCGIILNMFIAKSDQYKPDFVYFDKSNQMNHIIEFLEILLVM